MVSVMPISVARSKVHNHNVKGPKNVKWGTFCNMKGGTAYSQRGHGPLWPQASYVAGYSYAAELCRMLTNFCQEPSSRAQFANFLDQK